MMYFFTFPLKITYFCQYTVQLACHVAGEIIRIGKYACKTFFAKSLNLKLFPYLSSKENLISL